MLPTYNRLGQPSGRKSFHSREKCLIALVLLTLCLLCFGGIFLLPDNFGGERVLKVYKQFQKAGPEIFIPAPPVAPHGGHDEDPHVVDDRAKLQAKIREELGDILDKPEIVRNSVDDQQPPIAGPPLKASRVGEDSGGGNQQQDQEAPVELKVDGRDDPDPEVQEKRNKVKKQNYSWNFEPDLSLAPAIAKSGNIDLSYKFMRDDMGSLKDAVKLHFILAFTKPKKSNVCG